VADYTRDDAGDFAFFPPTWSLMPEPSTARRNDVYRQAVVPLAERAAAEALDAADLAPEDVTHLVAVSCTGFFAPGLDIALVRRLGLAPTTPRTLVTFMGCYAAFNALRVAHGFCQSDPEARVLVVCAELCTLHFRASQTLESAVVNALFADGAAATVVSSRAPEDAAGQLAYAGARTQLDGNSMEAMTWDLGDHGFRMGLASSVPGVLAQHLPAYAEALLAPEGLTDADVDFWAIHPGGRAIVEKAQEVLGLADADVAPSLGILRDYGNMSSPTVLFVLKRMMEEAEGRPLGDGVAMAFGPGLTLEGALLRTVR
jgi:predicted naringenin-chalcone synthase